MPGSRLEQRLGQIISIGFLILVYLFLLGPMIVVIIGSFNSAVSFPSAFESFTLHWYQELLGHDEFIKSMWVSVRIGVVAATLALLLGVPLAMLLVRKEFPGKNSVNAFFTSPLIIPQVAAGIALLQMFALVGLRLNEVTLILGHTIFVLPFVLAAAISSLHFVDPSVEEAAMNLGANRIQTFFYITLPMIRTGVVAGFFLAFIISFINVPLSLFLSTPGTTTLPIRVFAHMESRLDPLVAAVGALTILAVAVIAIFLEKVLKVRLFV